MEFVAVDEVPGEVAMKVHHAVGGLGGTNVEKLAWYHDLPIWLISQRSAQGDVTRTVQVAVVRSQGELLIEITLESGGEVYDVQLPADADAEDVKQAVRSMWQQ